MQTVLQHRTVYYSQETPPNLLTNVKMKSAENISMSMTRLSIIVTTQKVTATANTTMKETVARFQLLIYPTCAVAALLLNINVAKNRSRSILLTRKGLWYTRTVSYIAILFLNRF